MAGLSHHHPIPPVLLQTPRHLWPQKLQPDMFYINVEECQTSKYLTTVGSKVDKGLVGLCLSIRHSSMVPTGAELSSKLLTSGLLPRQVGGMGPNSRSRISNAMQSRNYDRLLMFADLGSTNGRCFACILDRNSSPKFFAKMMNSEEGVGDIMVFEEPSPVEHTLGSTTSVAIVDFRTGSTRVLPAVGHYEDVVPVTPLLSPSAGDTTFFARHHVTNLKLGGASFQEAICSGRLCDRQMEKKAAGWKCGCFYQNKENKLVVEMEVGLEVPLSFDPSGTKVVRNFRSLRTSNLFVAPDCWAVISTESDPYQNRCLRKAVKKVLEYVNHNGGWTYVGWVRTGTVQDTSDTAARESDNIASRDQAPHISYLYPTDTQILAEGNVAYQACKLTLQSLADGQEQSQHQQQSEEL